MAKKWTTEELKILKSSVGIVPKIDGRSIGAVRLKMQTLGLYQTNNISWKEEELCILKSYKSGDPIPVIKNRKTCSIKRKLYSMGFRWPSEKRWTKEEENLIESFILNGKFPKIKDRTEYAIRRKMSELLKNISWTEAEIDDLKSGRVFPDKTIDAIKNQLLKLSLERKQKHRKPWRDEDIQKLKELHQKGYSAKKIHEMKIFNTGVYGIQHKLKRLGLVKGNEIKRFSKTTRANLKNFLLNNYQGKTPQELTDLWNQGNSEKVPYKNILAYLHMLNIKIPYYEVQKINNLRKKEKKLIEGSKSITETIKTAIRKERIKIMRSRIENNLDIWSGLKVDEDLQNAWKESELSV